MSDEIPDKCPYCNASVKDSRKTFAWLECGSSVSKEDGIAITAQRTGCIIRQRDQLFDALSELSAEVNAKVPALMERVNQLKKAGDMLASHCDNQLALHEWITVKGRP